MMYFVILFVIYIGLGYCLHVIVFPEKKPNISTYFKPGDIFYSKTERIKQTVVKHENGFVYCTACIDPFAPGPPEHIHTDFDEVFEVANGELSMLMNGEVYKIRPGQKLLIAKGTPHKPFNHTADTIYTNGMVAFTEKFAFNLVQVYGLLDNEKLGKSLRTILQMSLLNQAGFDSYVTSLPVYIQKIIGFVLAPSARLFGYKSYYSKYDIRRN